MSDALQVDWLAGTITEKPIGETLDALGQFLGEWQELEYGGRGYECSAVIFGTGRIFWSYAHPRMGVHVSFPSSAIAASGFESQALIAGFVHLGMKFTRVDFAMDDTTGILNLDEIASAVKQKSFVSRSKKWTQIENESGGRTINLGVRSSQTFLRIYDKAKEQKIEGHWIRVELELKDERADAAIRELLDETDWSKKVASWLLGYVDFKACGSDTNKSRWLTVDWWAQFLGFVEKSRLHTPKCVKTIDDVIEWLTDQCAPSLFVVWSAFGSHKIQMMIDMAAARLKAKHLGMIQSVTGFAGVG